MYVIMISTFSIGMKQSSSHFGSPVGSPTGVDSATIEISQVNVVGNTHSSFGIVAGTNYQESDRLLGNYSSAVNDVVALAKTIRECTESECAEVYIEEEVRALATTDSGFFKQLQSYQSQYATQSTLKDRMYKIALRASQKESFDNKAIAEQNAKKLALESKRANRNQWIAFGGTFVAIVMTYILSSHDNQC